MATDSKRNNIQNTQKGILPYMTFTDIEIFH